MRLSGIDDAAVLVPPKKTSRFIYLSVADTSIASVVVQLYEGVEKVVFYLRRMLDAETRYPEVEKLCLCLFFTCTKLHHILLTAEIIVICKSHVVGPCFERPTWHSARVASGYSFSIRLSTPCTNNVANMRQYTIGFYWPTMLEDCFNYYKGCQACQMFGKIQMVPASAMNPIIKPWPFRGWGMDMIGKIHPASSKKHEWILVITDYFTKWVEAVPMKKVKSEDVIKFVKEHVIHRFGIPQTITTDGGSVFVSKEFRKFCDDMGIKLIRSSPYYAQANGQAEASNQSLIKLIKRKIDENPRDWHEKLSEALWAYRMSCHGAIKTSPYQLVSGQRITLGITAGQDVSRFNDRQ
ncbi:hypothetical protein QYE76_039016 [Lolium multiflorum]|uniref:Integrase catalytic domain-containing protein n=1 Tax=Lolium multiflorum TaxID=4521 RepID=A0AAD8WU33_LOLMU|nr:hypothetical protein QYE76_039016 [Lolium multiflorum]